MKRILIILFSFLLFSESVIAQVTKIANVEQLRKRKGSANAIAELQGYYTPNDGGGQQVVWNATSTKTDNGGTVFQVSGVSVGRWESLVSEYVKVKWFGVKADGIFDDSNYIQKAANLKKTLIFDGNEYNVGTTSILVYSDIIGNKSKIKGRTILSIERDSVTVSNLHFEGNNVYTTPNSGTVADIAIISYNRSNIKISDCYIKNARIMIRNNQYAEQKNIEIVNCDFDADFSNFDYVVTQNDVITIRGVNGVKLEHNKFKVNNVHRVLKFADTEIASDTLISSYRTRNVKIINNQIEGTTTSGKQVADFYAGTSDVYIEHNIIKVSGFSWIIENKTGSIADFTQNFNVTNNIFQNDNTILNFQGSYGATRPGFNVGYQNVKITGNTLIRSGVTTQRLLEVRYYHNVDIINNEIIAPLEMTAGVGASAVNLFSNHTANFSNNTVTNGCVYFTNSTTNSANGGPFVSPAISIKCNNNNISNFGGTAFLGGIYFSAINWENCIAEISNNTITQKTDDAGSSGAITFNNTILKKALVIGNVSSMASTTKERLRILSSTIKIQEDSNSWNLVGKANATFDPPSLNQYGISTTNINVDGAAFGDNVEVSFTRGLSTINLSAWVSNANTITVQFYNVGVTAIDLASGTIAIKVKRYTL